MSRHMDGYKTVQRLSPFAAGLAILGLGLVACGDGQSASSGDVSTSAQPAEFEISAATGLDERLFAANVRVLDFEPSADPLALFDAPQPFSFAGNLAEGTAIETPRWFALVAVRSPGKPGTQWEGQTLVEHCGGTIIHPHLVVTAAHCVVGQDGVSIEATEIGIRVAPHSREATDALTVTSTLAAIPATYEGIATNYREDMALVYLPDPVPLENVMPLAAVNNTEPFPDGATVCTIGMGVDQQDQLLSRTHIKRFSLARNGDGTLGLRPTFGEAFRPGDSGSPGFLCHDDALQFTVPLRMVGITSSLIGDKIFTLTSARAALRWGLNAAPLLVEIASN